MALHRLVLDTVLRLWRKTLSGPGFATDHIAAAFRQDRRIGSHERRDISESLYGMLRQLRRLQFALAQGGWRAVDNDQADLATYLAWLVTEARIPPGVAALELSGPNWNAVARVDEKIALIEDGPSRFALARSLPDWLARRFLDEFGDEADALAAALNRRAPLVIRTNTARISREALAARLKEEGVVAAATLYSPHGLVFASHVNAFGLAAFREGLFEVQDEGSQLIAHLVAAPPGGSVADICAGAGGKTLAIAAQMGGRGRILALDTSKKKLAELSRRCRRAGVSSVRAVQIPPDSYPPEVEKMLGRMDRVLADVPCSGIGAMRRNPDTRWRLSEEDLHALPKLQEAIASRGVELLRPGGRLIYATCTMLPDENERVVERLLAADSRLELVRAAEVWGNAFASPLTDPTGTFLKLLPHRHDTDGFFAAVLRRR